MKITIGTIIPELIIKEYVNRENNWLLTEIEVRVDGQMMDRRLQVIDMNTATRTEYIDDVWEYEWEEIK